jgi:hypothetical protein
MPTERWERRERKLQARRKRIPMSGRGLITIILPLMRKRAWLAKEQDFKRKRGKGQS